MRVLFDQAIPVPIRTFLIGHTVRTASQQHWDTLKNGELLTVAEQAGFEVVLTVVATESGRSMFRLAYTHSRTSRRQFVRKELRAYVPRE